MAPTVITTGVKTGINPASGPPPRQNIWDFVKDNRQFSLYVQALGRMSEADQKQVASAFQVGGIHGMPYIPWDSAGGSKPVSDEWEGYCTHGSVLFPIWHRPYVAVYEQLLHLHVLAVAAEYETPDKSQWQHSADIFRLPFWDWAQQSVPPDSIIREKSVTITDKTGKSVSVPNPIYSYRFHPVSDGQFEAPFKNWENTLRCPDNDDPNATTNVTTLVKNLTGPAGATAYQIRHATYVLLTQVATWLNMSNHTKTINPDYASSLEKIHDNIHVYTGGDGHMGDPNVAGFDPIFFLHHCNVDRILALWQAINYDSFVPESSSNDGTWTIAPKSKVNSETALAPFWIDPKAYWNADACREFTTLGYTYPEFIGQDLSDKERLKLHIQDIANKLYGERFLPLPGPPVGAPTPAPGPGQTPKAPKREEGELVDWRVRIESKKFELGGSYSVLIFLGDVPKNPSEWKSSPNFVGSSGVFANSTPQHCANCRQRGDVVVDGAVYLNKALLEAPEVQTYDPEVVVPYLKENLHWRVLQKGKEVDIAKDLPSLNVTVVHAPIHFGRGDQVPHRMGSIGRHLPITAGRRGGANE